MASSVSTTVGAVKLNLGSCKSGTSVPGTTPFLGGSLKRVTSRAVGRNIFSKKFKVVAEIDEEKQTGGGDRWKGLAHDISDDQQDITRGKGMVDSLFQAPMGAGTHDPVLSSYEYISQGLRQFEFDNNMDGYYIAPAFMDKLVVHIVKNFMNLPSIKVPLILGIWGGKGQGKSFQCELVFAKMGINPIMMSAGELESGNAGEPAKLIRQRYREAADRIAKGKMCVLFINDLDAGAGRMGGTTQYTVNNQMVNATLMNIADNPTNVQLPGMYNKEENPRVPIIVTGNDFSTLYAPLIRDGRMEKFYWAPTREDRIGICTGIFRADNVPVEDIVKLVDRYPGQSIDFFGAIRARVYDDEVRKWISSVGVESIGKKLVNSREAPPNFDKPQMTLNKLFEYGDMLVQEQENVKRVQLADKYLKEAALGDANEDTIKTGNFYGKAAQQMKIPVTEGCTDPNASNYDPTARSDDGSCSTMYDDIQKEIQVLKPLKSEEYPKTEPTVFDVHQEIEDSKSLISEQSPQVESTMSDIQKEVMGSKSLKSEKSPVVESVMTNIEKEVQDSTKSLKFEVSSGVESSISEVDKKLQESQSLNSEESLVVESIISASIQEVKEFMSPKSEDSPVVESTMSDQESKSLKSEKSPLVESTMFGSIQKEVDESKSIESQETPLVEEPTMFGSIQEEVEDSKSLKSEETPFVESTISGSSIQEKVEESKSLKSQEFPEKDSNSWEDLIILSYLLLRYLTALGLKLMQG